MRANWLKTTIINFDRTLPQRHRLFMLKLSRKERLHAEGLRHPLNEGNQFIGEANAHKHKPTISSF